VLNLLVGVQIKLREDFVPGDEFFSDEERRSDHSESSVRELFQFVIEIQLIARIGTETERVKTNLTGNVIVSQSE
jgi:hypothetical protein